MIGLIPRGTISCETAQAESVIATSNDPGKETVAPRLITGPDGLAMNEARALQLAGKLSAPGTTAPTNADISQPAQTAGAVNSIAPALPFQPSGFGLPSQQLQQLVQPIADLPSYLSTRAPVPSHKDEPALFTRLPEALRHEVKSWEHAFRRVRSLSSGRDAISVQAACKLALAESHALRGTPLKTFRFKYDVWLKSGDWLTLVNRCRAGADWQDRDDGLPSAFIEKVCAPHYARFARADGKRQAILAIQRWWRTGRDLDGLAKPIPGYEADWNKRNPEVYPAGWSHSNIRRQIKARAQFTPAVRALLHEGIAAAKEQLPTVLATRAGLRFLEVVTFDDVRIDTLIFDPETGQPCELWLLVARDQATAMVLGFVMHTTLSRDMAGTTVARQGLGQKEMKQLAAWILERYPLPLDYLSTWRIERGTATLSEGSALALQEMLPDRIRISYTSMIGGKSPLGYREKATGNPKGKASHESHNRILQTQSSFLPGQTGAHYGIRPAALKARADECAAIWELRNRLPEHLRGQEQYTLLLPAQARKALFQICLDQNFRTDHALEGFDQILEWLDPATGKWMPQSMFGSSRGNEAPITFRKRMEMPVERAVKLIAGHRWTKASPDVIIAFLQHTIRPVKINATGEIKFSIEDSPITFYPPAGVEGWRGQQDSKRSLAYFNPDDPRFLHVTDAKGAILGTWYRRERAAYHDQTVLQEALRYTANALKSAQEYAQQISAGQRAQIETVRAHNAELERGNEFVEVAAPPIAIDSKRSLVAAALSSAPATRAQIKADAQAAEAADDESLRLFRQAANSF